ncbi:gephyrin-like molybdotransferase receptor GlpR [Rhodococcus sp. Q1]|uniref:divisome protein SepX/GlpR n=1 Tax=unclassified Rhodococcus (in: high G+C Gram-positive bacteria) TaxID=192944 RepID=UPI00102196FA|nr:gephyrin-like molybdotransferase receptor GlpR [Rhodococcus sp. Q1]
MPNSLLWIGLVAVWLFVLVPMLVTKRPRIRQTTDAALATRVLHRGDDEPIAPRGPAAGHRSDPHWRPSRDRTHRTPAEDRMNTDLDDRPEIDSDETDLHDDAAPEREPVRAHAPQRRGRGGFDPHADAVASAARYEFRQRAVLGLLIAAIMTSALALIVSSLLWWPAGLVAVALVGYLFYLRRQVRLEQEIRRRRLARLQRSRAGGARGDHHYVPQRLRRPGAVVLEVDDEDPEFEHLDRYEDDYGIDHVYDVRASDGYDEPGDYVVPRAVGE